MNVCWRSRASAGDSAPPARPAGPRSGHTILTSGSWDREGTWKAVFGWDRPVLRELFQLEVFRFLRQRELLSTERIDLIRSWRHSGFDVFVGEPIVPDDRQALEHVARYLLRAPVSLERMRYDPQAALVSILPLPGEQGGCGRGSTHPV